MNEEKRINAGYEIIESCTIGSTELVIGHNPKAYEQSIQTQDQRVLDCRSEIRG